MTYDPDRTCSVPRNNPQDEAYQSSPAQEEWAVDQAVRGDLTGARGPNLYGSGLPAYRPQGSGGIFPLPGLTGGGRVPAQVMLGVLAQESAEYQASFHVIDGQAGNPEVGLGWYGDTNPNAPFHVDWAAADCGYGTAQVTTGMCLAGNPHCGSNNSPFPLNSQIAVAIDYQANIAAGLQILEQKWNEVYSHGVKANGADPQRLENWWFALWDYNSGYHPGPAGSPNGLGWVNNPINPMYPPDREMFLSGNYNFDVAHPQNWSYEEKVIGFAAYGLFRFDFVHQKDSLAFAKGGWPANDPPAGEPAHSLFCNSTDNCSPSAAQPCQLSSDECWWHEPATWGSNCADCGAEVMSYPAGAPDPGSPGVPPGYAPDCSNSPLPGGAVIVGDTASSLPAPLGCGTSWSTNGGTMTWQFGADTRTSPATYPSKVDFHQISAGYGGHFWFTHTIPSKSNDPISIAPQQPQFQITGTWKAPSSVTGWTRVMVSIPNYGAWDPQANYQVNLGGSAGTDHQVVNQAYQANTWVSLGIFDLHSGANVSLGNVTFEGLGYDIAWGAVAFIHSPTPGADYVAMGDSYSSGEGLQPFDPNSDYNNAGQKDACHRSGSYGIGQAYSQLVKQPGQSSTIAQQAKNLAGGTQYQFAACSGDFTTGVTEKAVGSPEMANTPWDALHLGWHELPQADAGYLGPQTSLVTLTLGGDDARFSSVLKGCILTKGDCTDSNFFMKDTSTGKLDPQPLIQYEPQVINNLQQHLEDVYTAIAKAAPNAKIIVLGYPRLFPGDTSDPNGCQVDAAIDIPGDVTSWLNKMGDLIDQVTANAVKSAAASGDKIFYVDPRSAFNNNEICNLDGTENSSQWINGLINFSKSGSGRQVPGAGSFHPRAAGQVEYAKLANACLASAANC